MNLKLTMSEPWFSMVRSGEKTEEYREIKAHYAERLIACSVKMYAHDVSLRILFCGMMPVNHSFKPIKTVTFYNGGFMSPKVPHFTADVKPNGIRVGYGKPEWGADPGKLYFVLEIGEVLAKPAE